MRTLSSAAVNAATAPYGSEPANIIEIQWVKNGSRTSYADKNIDSIPGRILQLSNLDFIVDVSSGSDSAEISIILSDIDGSLKNIIDHNDVHKREVWVYQWFEDIPLNDKFLLFHGVINSPLVWNEGDRTLSFTVINKIEDAEIGFSIEEGQFTNIPENLIGKPWPLKFGTTYNVPALRFNETIRGSLVTGTGIADYWLPLKINSLLICPDVFIGFRSRYEGISLQITPAYQPDPACLVRACQAIREAEIQYAEQLQYQFPKIRVLDGDKFPQGEELTLDIGGGLFTGSFGDPDPRTFTITSRQHPDFAELGPATDANLIAMIEEEDQGVQTGCGVPDLFATGGAGGSNPIGNSQTGGGGSFAGESAFGTTIDAEQLSDESIKNLYASEQSFNRFNAIPTPGFFWAPAGAEVKLAENQELIYASNLVPETVHRVAAFRQLDNQRRLVTVPESFYSVRVSDFNGYMVSEIVFPTPLSRISDTWDDDIYITSTSSVGPNTVDIMEWLIDKYTDLLTDPASFNNVRARLQNYPMDFPYLERKNVLAALRELAFQARCAIYLRDNRFFLKYLAEAPAADDIISTSDIDNNSLELFHTPTEDIVTKFVIEWKRDYALDEPNTVILRHNVNQYGVQEQTYDFYAYNELDYITKSGTFWIIRFGNTWRKVRFTTTPNKLALETFDAIDFNSSLIFPTAIRSLIEQADYDSQSRLIQFSLHTNVKSGSLTPYPFFHPADIQTELIWPQSQEWDEGIVGSGPDAPGFSVVAPPGHPLAFEQLPQGFSFGPCSSEATLVTYETLQQVAKKDVPLTDPRFDASFRRQGRRTCGDDKGDPTPSDQDDSVKQKELSTDQPIDGSPIPQSEVYTTPREKLKDLGGDDPATAAKKQADKALGAALTAGSRATAANEAAEGPGSGTENPNPGPEDLPSQDELRDKNANEQNGQDCLFTANIFIREAQVLGGPNGSEGPGFLGQSTPVRQDRITFRTCIEAQKFVCAVLTKYAERQANQDIVKGEQLPTNANSVCPNYFPPCDNTPPTSSPDNPSALPTPIGFDSIDPGGAPIESPGDTGYIDDALEFLSNDPCL
jgi:hypothetical protein